MKTWEEKRREAKYRGTLAELIEHARQHEMTDDERREQVASFAFGNLALTREWSSKPLAELEQLRQLCRKLAGCKE